MAWACCICPGWVDGLATVVVAGLGLFGPDNCCCPDSCCETTATVVEVDTEVELLPPLPAVGWLERLLYCCCPVAPPTTICEEVVLPLFIPPVKLGAPISCNELFPPPRPLAEFAFIIIIMGLPILDADAAADDDVTIMLFDEGKLPTSMAVGEGAL